MNASQADLADDEEFATDEQWAATTFEPWQHAPNEWKPPSNEDWSLLAPNLLPYVRMAWISLYRTKAELEPLATLEEEAFEELIGGISNSRKFFEGFVTIGTLIATGFAACYTRKQWRTAADQEQRSLRAYVMVQSSEIGYKDTGELTVTINIKNFGSTPAYNVRHWACAMVNRFPDQDIDFPTAAEIVSSREEAPGSLIPPSGTLGKNFIDLMTCKGKTVSPEDWAAIKAGHKTIFAIGVIKYRDAFHNEWVTDYRRGWDPVNNGVDGYKGNCADEDCPKDAPDGAPVVK
jgi:hypothetical protein